MEKLVLCPRNCLSPELLRDESESETPRGVLFVFFQEKRPYFWPFWVSRMAFDADSGNFIGCFLQK